MSIWLGTGFGGTKNGEYRRTIEMLMGKTNLNKKDLAMLLYFLYDCQYDNKDLKSMADLALEDDKLNKKYNK